MSKMTKVVNIYPTMPITGVNPPIRSAVKGVTKSIEEIRTCILARAVVEEIVNGKIIRLDNSNYDKFLGSAEGCKGTDAYVEEVAAEVESVDEEKSTYDKAYEEALAGKDLASMTRKERRRAEAAARDAASKAVAEEEAANVTVSEEAPAEEVPVETEEVEQEQVVIAESSEDEIETMDVEELGAAFVE